MMSLLLLVAVPCWLGAAETWVVQGRSYENVRVREATPDAVTIFHKGGIKKFALADLPVELQERFAYDAEAAEEFSAAEAREREAAEAARLKREQELAKEREAARAQDRRTQTDPAGAPAVIEPEDVRFYPELDLRPFYIEKGLYTKNQGRRPSCSVFALVSALEYEQARRTGTAARLSEEFLIWATLRMQPGIPLDTGFNFPEVITALQTYGVPPHEFMPNTYGKSAADIRPSKAAIMMAQQRKQVLPVWFRRDDPDLVARIVGVLNQKKPVIIGVRWPHWRTLDGNYLLKNQKPLENASHAVTLVGYRNTGGTPEGTTFIFRNSYGYQWGLAGCGFIHEKYLREHLVGAFFLQTGQ
jgi:hypothetical protein